MKKLIILTALLLLQKASFGQDSEKIDTIFRLNKEIITCKVVSITEKEVIYSFQGETLTNTLSKNQIKEIHFSSGRIQKISEIIDIKGEDDWGKVQITNIESDISGLVKKGDVSGRANSFGGFSTEDAMKRKAEMKIKKQAAALGAHIVFIKSYQSNQNTEISSARASISGIAFGYK
jgi:hypothetical protein